MGYQILLVALAGKVRKMNVSLTPELEKIVTDKVATGRYTSASEVIREALRLMEEMDALRQRQLETLRQEIQKGSDSIERGDSKIYASAKEMMDDIRKQGREHLKASKQKKAA